MEIQVTREPFLRALQLLQNIVEPRQTLPILANVLKRHGVYSYATAMNDFADQQDLRLQLDVLTKTKSPELHRYWTTASGRRRGGCSGWRPRCCTGSRRGVPSEPESQPIHVVETFLNHLLELVGQACGEFGGKHRFEAGDSHCLTFPEAHLAIAAAERVVRLQLIEPGERPRRLEGIAIYQLAPPLTGRPPFTAS